MKSGKQDDVVATPPDATWKRIKIDTTPLLKAVGKGVLHALSGKVTDVPIDVVDALGALNIAPTTDERAYKLIERSLARGSYDLAFDALNFLADGNAQSAGQLNAAIEGTFSDITVIINSDFLRAPDRSDVVSKYIPILSQWLIDIGAAPYAAESISSRFPSYFVYALHKEWKSRRSDYEAIFDVVNGPFHGALERLSEWSAYFSELRRRIEENVFNEPFGLSQIYVPLHAYTVVKGDSDGHSPTLEIGARQPKKDAKVAVDLDAELTRWLDSADKDDALRVISGGPGSGKSSFLRVFCAKLAENGKYKPLYIPLHLIDPTKDVADEVSAYLRDEGTFSSSPVDPKAAEENLLLVFDGLDELASQGAAARNVAKDFVAAVELLLMRRNQRDLRLRALLSGRELVVQENETSFRKPGEVLTILPYFTAQHERKDFHDPTKLLDTDLRAIWWSKYATLTGRNFATLPEALNKDELVEITSQPLLSYLVALSFNRGSVDFSKEISLNNVYGDLLSAVYERGYEKHRLYRPIAQMQKADFCRILEEIGLAAWQSSDGRSTSVDDILRHCEQSGLGGLLEIFREGAEYGVTRLLAAFFFRQHNRSAEGRAAFVFTHKSFGEYLTALRLRRGVDRICIQLDRRKSDPDDGWDLDAALEHWISLTGPSALTPYISKFLSSEFALQDTDLRKRWLEKMATLLSHAINRDLPMSKLRALTYRELAAQARNAKEALLVTTHLLAITCETIVSLDFVASNSFGTFLRSVVPQRTGPKSELPLRSLGWIDFSRQTLDLADFYASSIGNALFRGAALNLATFERAVGREADFRDVTAYSFSASGGIFPSADFSNAQLENARFTHAHLSRASFRNAKLRNADFSDADLTGADFTGAEVSRANFKGAKLSNARLDHIQFKQKPGFSAADLTRASFEGVDIQAINVRPERLISVEKKDNK